MLLEGDKYIEIGVTQDHNSTALFDKQSIESVKHYDKKQAVTENSAKFSNNTATRTNDHQKLRKN